MRTMTKKEIKNMVKNGDIERLIIELSSNNKKNRLRAAITLKNFKEPKVVEALSNAIDKETDEYIIMMSLNSLGEIGDIAIESILKNIDHPSGLVRMYVALSLGKIKSEKVIKPLKKLSQDKDESVRAAANSAWGEIRKKLYDSKTLYEPLTTRDINDKGTLLYQMPEEIYKKNLQSELSDKIFAIFYGSFGTLGAIFIIGSLFIDYFEGMYIVGAILVFVPIFVYIDNYPKKSKRPLSRFTIFKKGYVPAIKPRIYYKDNKEYLILFDSIEDIEWGRWGGVCKLFLKNGKEERVSEDWNDIDGYLKWADIIIKKFPNKKYPNLDVVKERFNANSDRVKGRISNKEYEEIYERSMEINNEFSSFL